jgi:hypothetical protein
MLLNVDVGALGRILLWEYKFGTVEPWRHMAPTCTAKGRDWGGAGGFAPPAVGVGVIPLGNFFKFSCKTCILVPLLTLTKKIDEPG